MQFRNIMGMGLCALMILAGKAGAQGPVEELKDVDRAFAAHSKEHGPRAAFLAYMAEDGIVLRATGEPLKGRAAYAEATAEDMGDAQLSWAPEGAAASDDGTLGFTWGYYHYVASGDDGAKQDLRGKYLSVWRRQEDDSWKFIADIGNIDPASRGSNGSQ